MLIVTISHIVNVVVAGGIAYLLFTNAQSMTVSYGEASPARAILSSVYLAIALTSAFALVFPTYSIMIAKVLFPLQIVYKLSTVITVGSIAHPVVSANVLISVLHAVSLFIIWR
jgi:hypothetical protein